MGFIKERVSYLKGLAEGIKINDSTDEGKLLKTIIEVLDDIANSVEDIEEIQEHLGEQVDDMDEDLAQIERILYDECDDEEDDDFIADVECPHCNETVELTEEMLDSEEDSFKCSACGKDIIVEWDCDCGCEDCEDEEK
ncbi:UNVERIFIED_CONTAM: hypothetical protein Cloal_4429 [Acetivibrio alkalicellulosi]